MKTSTSLLSILFFFTLPAFASDIGLFQNLNGDMPAITLALNPGTFQEIDLTAAGDGTSGTSGTYNAIGGATGTYTDGDSGYFAGTISGLEFRNYFAFDESGLTPGLAVSSATVTLDEPTGGFVGTDSLIYTLYSLEFSGFSISDLVSGAGGTNAFADLGNGTAYASAPVPVGSTSPVVLYLNADAISLIEAEEGQGFVPFGGAVTGAAVTSTPEPSTFALLASLGAAICLFGMRRLRLRFPAKKVVGYLLIGSVTMVSAQNVCSTASNGQTLCLNTNGYIISATPVTYPSSTATCGTGSAYDPDTGACVIIAGPAASQFCLQSPLDLIFPNQVVYVNGTPQENANLEAVANEGINAYLVSQNIPNYTGAGCYNNAVTRLRLSQPDQAAAAAFLQFMVVIGEAPAQRTAAEQAAFDWLTAELKTYRVNAALAAQAEYEVWKTNPCTYIPPQGFPYTPPTAACSNQSGLASILASPDTLATPPDFLAIGTFRAFPSLATGAGNLKASDIATQITDIAANAGVAYASSAAVSLLQRIPPSLSYQLVKAIFPFVLNPAESKAVAAAAEAGESVLDVLDVAGRFAGPIAIVIGSVVDVVFAAVNIVTDADRGKHLQADVNNAKAATIDLNAEIATPDGLQQLMGIFADQVNLTPIDAVVIPAPVYATFTETDQGFNQLSTTALPIVYRTWDQSVWSSNFVVSSGWWEHAPLGSTSIHTAGIINYLDWEGRQLTATYSTANNVFLVTGYPAGSSVLTDALYVVDQNNTKKRYVLNNPTTGVLGGFWSGPHGAALVITTLGGGYLETSTMFRNAGPGGNVQEFIGVGSPQLLFGSMLVGGNSFLGNAPNPGILVWGADNNPYVEYVDTTSLVVTYIAEHGGSTFTRPYYTFRDITSGANLIGTFTP